MSDQIRSEYPEHDKMLRIADKSQAIGEFLEWLGEVKNINLVTWVEQDEEIDCPGDMFHDCVDGFQPDRTQINEPSNRTCTRCNGKGTVNQHFEGWVPQPQPVQALLAEHFDIDLKKIETEKRAMLERMREVHI